MTASPQTNPATASTAVEITYPDSDGKPMADNTLQFRWIVTIKENLEILFANDPEVFVAGDLLWYPVEGNNRLCQAPDAMVVFGRTKGDRGSYQQWKENNIAPQVVFEILSPSNTGTEMTRKLLFYQQYGVEEYYQYDPDANELVGSQRENNALVAIADLQGWVSPRLGIRFEVTDETLGLHMPNGDRFLTTVELAEARDQALQQAAAERQRADAEQQRADRLAARLRAMGIDPDQV
ncbi:Uma2 family endonuclease [Leptolyngbya iicbica]|uniref:Uma2 family endonuclease n=2 Tax=Cyanophyceae TaxID=3028117 RepID=A0A4Q7E493_9CYAN|nr:Uma2 family endonuclease [Leptolyngbya sp. LK]RZM76583.1 Uma2 family endonuclease [Leptolyngbya sp. LK]